VYVTAVAVALHPVFLVAAVVMLGAFGLSWRLRDVPLRETAASTNIAESFAAPREAALGKPPRRTGRREPRSSLPFEARR
jgi:hypothetical protein